MSAAILGEATPIYRNSTTTDAASSTAAKRTTSDSVDSIRTTKKRVRGGESPVATKALALPPAATVNSPSLQCPAEGHIVNAAMRETDDDAIDIDEMNREEETEIIHEADDKERGWWTSGRSPYISEER